MLELLKQAKTDGIVANYVLFDSWFFSPSSLHAVKGLGYDVISMVKKTPEMFFHYKSEDMDPHLHLQQEQKETWAFQISSFCYH